jgi:hypothetical protein
LTKEDPIPDVCPRCHRQNPSCTIIIEQVVESREEARLALEEMKRAEQGERFVTMKPEELRDPPEPTKADKQYVRMRDGYIQRAGKRLPEAERKTRELEEHLSQRRPK